MIYFNALNRLGLTVESGVAAAATHNVPSMCREPSGCIRSKENVGEDRQEFCYGKAELTDFPTVLLRFERVKQL